MRPFAYYAPGSLSEALAVLGEQGQGGRLLAGGTDLLVQIKERDLAPRYVVSLRNLSELEAIEEAPDGGLTFGARVSMRRIELDPRVQQRYTALSEAAGMVGSIQVRNLATIGGNLCNAAPSADTAPALMVLDAEANIVGPDGSRTVPVETFFQGPGRTVLRPGEIVISVQCPAPAANSGSTYLRHTPRAELDIAVVGVAARVTLAGDGIADARIALASVAPVPVRAPSVEEALRGREPSAKTLAEAAALVSRHISPISDQRGSAGFRLTLSEVLTRRALARAVDNARQGKGQ